MKKMFLKYITIVLTSLLIIGLYCYATTKQKNSKSNIQTYNVERVSMIKDTILNISIVNIDTLNPIISNNQNVQDIDKLIFDSLLQLDEEYKLQLGLAKEYAKINDNEYILKLKDNIIWHNGSEFTAEDVNYTIKKIKESNDKSIYYSNIKDIKEVIIIDDNTIKIILNEPISFFEYKLIFPIIYRDQDNLTNLVGTNKYKIIQTEEDKIILEKWENYWGVTQEKINKINIKLYESTGKAYQSFKDGDIDLLVTNNIDVENYIGSIGYKSESFIDRQYEYIVCNIENQILSQKEVRQAIMYAINKKEIIEKICNSKYKIANSPLDYAAYINDYKEEQIYSTQKAREILTTAGWKEEDGNWTLNKEGKKIKLQLNLTICDQNEERILAGEIIKEQLEQIGIKINVRILPESIYNQEIENNRYDLLLVGMQTSFAPELEMYLGKGNLSNYRNEEIKELIFEMNNIKEEAVLKQKYRQVMNIVENEVPYIGLYFHTKKFMYQKNLKGNISPTSNNLFYFIETWYKENYDNK